MVGKAEIAEGFYVAPELKEEDRPVSTVKSYVFDLGIIVLDMLFGFNRGRDKIIVLGKLNQKEQYLEIFFWRRRKKIDQTSHFS